MNTMIKSCKVLFVIVFLIGCSSLCFSQTNKIVYKIEEKYDGYESEIEFYDSNGNLIKTFNIRENNPFVPKSARQKYVSGEMEPYNITFEIAENERNQFNELFNTKEKIDAVGTFYTVDNRAYKMPIINYTVLAYMGYAQKKETGNFCISSYVVIFDEKGNVIRKMFLPDENCFHISISPDGKLLCYKNSGVEDRSENVINPIHADDFKIIDLSTGKNVFEPVENAILEMLSVESKYFTLNSGTFWNNGLFVGQGGKKLELVLFVADFENNKFYIRTYEAGEGDFVQDFWIASQNPPIDYSKFQTITIK